MLKLYTELVSNMHTSRKDAFPIYLQSDEDRADMDGKVKNSDDHADDQVRLQTLILLKETLGMRSAQ